MSERTLECFILVCEGQWIVGKKSYWRTVNCFFLSLVKYYFDLSLKLQEDAEELRSLGEQAKRQKVKDILTVALRKLETELSR